MSAACRRHQHQRGVAVITALLLTTLAITIVTSLFWQQQVQVRSIENQRLQLQKKWVLRGALDWARLILREDGLHSNVDHLGEPWAVALAETRLDQYVENGRSETEESDASLSGQIIDAQSRYNLNNLSINGQIDAREVAALQRLLRNLRLEPALAQGVASAVARTQKMPAASGDAASSGAKSGANPDAIKASESTQAEVQFLRFTQIDDLLAVKGFTPEMLLRLQAFVTVLPRKSAINVNTASAEVLAARIDGLSMADAAMLVASRERAYFKDTTDFKARLPNQTSDISEGDVDSITHFFIVNGKVKMNRSTLEVNALLERTPQTTRVLWVREN